MNVFYIIAIAFHEMILTYNKASRPSVRTLTSIDKITCLTLLHMSPFIDFSALKSQIYNDVISIVVKFGTETMDEYAANNM